MYTLENKSLSVSVLDPVADQARLGTRYCTGGYVFQVEDVRHGPLLSGPTYPDSFNWNDGQGLPEAFGNSLRAEDAGGNRDGGVNTGLVIGIGLCDLQARRVLEFCHWDVEQTASTIHFRTAHALDKIGLELERAVELRGRMVRSATRLRNTGGPHILLSWYPHPFFPHPDADELIRLNIPFSMPGNPGYEITRGGFIARKGWPWTEGHFQILDHEARSNLVVIQKHPTLGLIAATCSYVPSFFPIWGNRKTFSWEPYVERTVGSRQEMSWSIDYDF